MQNYSVSTKRECRGESNQHFVSQAYLRRFGVRCEEVHPRSIHLWALKARRTVLGASIKKQCSKNFFYGDEQTVEDLLQSFEGRYGAAITSIERGEIEPIHLVHLSHSTLLQHLRTPFQLQERLRVINEFGQMQIQGKRVREAFPDLGEVKEMQEHLRIFASKHSVFSDLKPVILRNKTKLPLITSDNPSVLINRLYSQRFSDDSSGLVQSGAVALMPLSPSIAFIAYDSDVIQAISRDAVFEVRNDNDISRLNELQVIWASETLYFQDDLDREYVETLFYKYAHRRRAEWIYVWNGIRDGEKDGFERYRKTRPEDQDSLEPRIQSMSPILTSPSSWPSFLKFKMRPLGWTTGSAVGFIRQAHIHRDKDFRKMVIPDRLSRDNAPAHREVIYQRKK